MDYSFLLLLDVILDYSNWFILYLVLYFFISFFVIGCTFIIFGGFVNIKRDNYFFMYIVAIIMLIGFFPKPSLFGFVEVKDQYVTAIKDNIHKTELDNLHSREITDLMKYKLNDTDIFYSNFTKNISTYIPKNIKFNMRDLDDALYYDYKQCFISKNKSQFSGSIKINKIYDEIQLNKVSCVRNSMNLFMQPSNINKFINNME